MKSDNAIFCRCLRKQKKLIVEIIKEYHKHNITLAIGDGANDLEMLSTARIGSGITKSQDQQVNLVSDYYFGEFRHIIPLLFIFGREWYRKNSSIILFNFYKNILVVMPNFWFGIFTFYTPLLLYDNLMYVLYDVIFTLFPIIFYGIWDRSFSNQKLLFSPLLYQTGIDDFYFNKKEFFTKFVAALVDSFIITISALALFDYSTYKNGYFFGFWNFGNMCYFASVALANLKVVSVSSSYSFFSVLMNSTGTLAFFLLWIFQNQLKSNTLFETFDEIIGSSQFYIFIVFIFGLLFIEHIYLIYDFEKNHRKYIPDFEVSYDANVQLSQIEANKIDLAFSGISDHQKDKLYENFESFSSSNSEKDKLEESQKFK